MTYIGFTAKITCIGSCKKKNFLSNLKARLPPYPKPVAGLLESNVVVCSYKKNDVLHSLYFLNCTNKNCIYPFTEK